MKVTQNQKFASKITHNPIKVLVVVPNKFGNHIFDKCVVADTSFAGRTKKDTTRIIYADSIRRKYQSI